MDKELKEKIEKKWKEKNSLIRRRVILLMLKKGLNQNSIARVLGKRQPEISKWLSGEHNLTLKSIIMLEVALDADIIEIEEYKFR